MFNKHTSNNQDVPNYPLFPFSYGLSYTTYDYCLLTLSRNSLTTGGNITASVTVTNTGGCEGTEVVQLYICSIEGSIARQVQQLKGYERITLKHGKSRLETFIINPDPLMFYNAYLGYICKSDEFDNRISTDSRNIQHQILTLK